MASAVDLGESIPDYWRLAIVEDHLLQRQRTQELFDRQAGMRVVFTADSLPDFVRWLETATPAERPHLLVLDLVVDRGQSADPETVRALTRAGLRVLVLSAMASPPLVREILRAGVGGVVGKRDPEEDIVGAAWTVLGRGQWMTPELAAVMAGDAQRPALSDQEERALVLYASGLTLDAVAASLGVKRDTAKTYLDRVKAKYAGAGRPVRSKVDLNRVALTDGYLDLGDAEPDAQVAPNA
ncbi:response regulator [Nocardioides marmoriginsengisoli]|uniref:response regulator n=1 Tax=Nocardioides marmoriginsengisoli TaxID=661483 RepID=UPI001612D66D|nr:response regulator [Nocardioides marmoriginsengisoli]